MRQSPEPVAQRAVFNCPKAALGLGLGRAGLRAFHHPVRRALGGPALLRDFGQRAQPAAAPGGGVWPAAGAAGVCHGVAVDQAAAPVARAAARAPTGLGGAGRDWRAQFAGIPAVVRAVSGGGALVPVDAAGVCGAASARWPGRARRGRFLGRGLCGRAGRRARHALGRPGGAGRRRYCPGLRGRGLELLAREPALPAPSRARRALSGAKLGSAARHMAL